MPRSIFTLLAELQSTLAELGEALDPLKALTAGFKGNDGPFPAKAAVRRRGPGRKKRAASRKGAATAAPSGASPAVVPAPAARAKSVREPARRAKGTAARLAMQGTDMSALRKLPKADQAEVKKARAEQGVEAAVKLALSKA